MNPPVLEQAERESETQIHPLSQEQVLG